MRADVMRALDGLGSGFGFVVVAVGLVMLAAGDALAAAWVALAPVPCWAPTPAPCSSGRRGRALGRRAVQAGDDQAAGRAGDHQREDDDGRHAALCAAVSRALDSSGGEVGGVGGSVRGGLDQRSVRGGRQDRLRPGDWHRSSGFPGGFDGSPRRVRLSLVVLADQGLGVDADGAGDRPDVAVYVEVTAAGVVVVLLDAADDRFPDPGQVADLVNRQTRPITRLGQRFANGHEASTTTQG